MSEKMKVVARRDSSSKFEHWSSGMVGKLQFFATPSPRGPLVLTVPGG